MYKKKKVNSVEKPSFVPRWRSCVCSSWLFFCKAEMPLVLAQMDKSTSCCFIRPLLTIMASYLFKAASIYSSSACFLLSSPRNLSEEFNLIIAYSYKVFFYGQILYFSSKSLKPHFKTELFSDIHSLLNIESRRMFHFVKCQSYFYIHTCGCWRLSLRGGELCFKGNLSS